MARVLGWVVGVLVVLVLLPFAFLCVLTENCEVHD
jgi:hypothetical protein